jgi:hypothetical protein
MDLTGLQIYKSKVANYLPTLEKHVRCSLLEFEDIFLRGIPYVNNGIANNCFVDSSTINGGIVNFKFFVVNFSSKYLIFSSVPHSSSDISSDSLSTSCSSTASCSPS